MSKIVPVPPHNERASEASVDPRAQKMLEAVRTLLSALTASEQEYVLRELVRVNQPIATPRAGEVLGAIVRLLPRRSAWTVEDVTQGVASEGVEATKKEIYNALGYLTRKGHVRRIGYGRYLVDGMGIITSDDLGGEPARYEDD